MKWQPVDVIAALALVCCTVLLLCGHNHTVTWAFGAIIGVYVLADLSVLREGNLAKRIRDARKKDKEDE